jgi:polysaccharide deacetylase family protein (PEP-CTERM system associated)
LRVKRLHAGGARNNIITLTVEDYFQVGAFSELIPFSHWERFDARIKRNTELALAMLDRHGAVATFFASGWIGENYPDILRAIVDAGHEVACQGYYQQSIRDIAPPAFRDDLRRSREAIQNATGQVVRGFRIGRGRLGPDDMWALDILIDEGFAYDASLSPIGRQFSRQPDRFILHRHTSDHGALWEVPASASSRFGWAIPFSGGNYVRQMPKWLTREAAARWVERRKAPLVMYFHIWELDANQPTISAAGWLQRMRHYRNLPGMPARIEYFLERYPFTSIVRYLELEPTAHARPAAREVPPVLNANVPTATTQSVTSLTIVVPCYNEEAALPYLHRTLMNFIEVTKTTIAPHFVFVDDGSSDTTWTKLQTLFGSRDDCVLRRHTVNRGIAAAIITGFDAATSDLVAVIDADCTFDPLQLAEMVPMLIDDIAVVAASPLHAGGRIANVPGWRLLLSRGAAFLYRLVLHHQLTSYTSCFRVYRRDAVSNLAIYNTGFCGVAEILARIDLAGHKIVECPAELETRLLGQSKINLLKTVCDHLRLITRIAAARWLKIALPRGPRQLEVDAG